MVDRRVAIAIVEASLGTVEGGRANTDYSWNFNVAAFGSRASYVPHQSCTPQVIQALGAHLQNRSRGQLLRMPKKQTNKCEFLNGWCESEKIFKSRAKWKGFFRQKPGCFWSWRPSLQCMSLTYTVGLFQWNAKWSLLEPGTSPQKLAYPEQIRKHKNLYKQLASLNLWTTVCQKLSLGNIFFILDWRSNDSPTTRQQVFLFETWDTSTSILSFFFSPYNEERQRQLTSDSIYM